MFNNIEYKKGETFYNNGMDSQVFNWRNGIVYTYKRSHFCYSELKNKALFIKLYFVGIPS